MNAELYINKKGLRIFSLCVILPQDRSSQQTRVKASRWQANESKSNLTKTFAWYAHGSEVLCASDPLWLRKSGPGKGNFMRKVLWLISFSTEFSKWNLKAAKRTCGLSANLLCHHLNPKMRFCKKLLCSSSLIDNHTNEFANTAWHNNKHIFILKLLIVDLLLLFFQQLSYLLLAHQICGTAKNFAALVVTRWKLLTENHRAGQFVIGYRIPENVDAVFSMFTRMPMLMTGLVSKFQFKGLFSVFYYISFTICQTSVHFCALRDKNVSSTLRKWSSFPNLNSFVARNSLWSV